MRNISLLEAKGMELSTIINDLNETFPPTNPTPNDSHAKVMYQAGQRSVVEWIFKQIDL